MLQFDLFSDKPTYVEEAPSRAKKEDKPVVAKKQATMGRYDSLGLDTTKRSEDKGRIVKSFHCVWDNVEVTRGYSMCFQHFVLSHQAAKRLQLEKGTENEDRRKCDKCKRVHAYLHITESEWFALCAECVDQAVMYLERPVYVEPGTQFNLL